MGKGSPSCSPGPSADSGAGVGREVSELEGRHEAGRGGGGWALRPAPPPPPAPTPHSLWEAGRRRARAARGWARRSINVCVSGPRVCGEAGARGSPGTRCAAAPLWPPPARRARTHGLARTWPGGADGGWRAGPGIPWVSGSTPDPRVCKKDPRQLTRGRPVSLGG